MKCVCVCVLSLFIHTINSTTRRELSSDWLIGLFASSRPGGFHLFIFLTVFSSWSPRLDGGDDDCNDGHMTSLPLTHGEQFVKS